MFQSVDLAFVSENGKRYIENNTLNYGISLLISDMNMVDPQMILDEKIPLNLDKFLSKLGSKQ